MAARSVLVTVTEAGSATGRGAEGLRAALGLARGFEGHDVRLLFRGDGVRWLVPSEIQKSVHVAGILAHLRAAPVPWYADEEAFAVFGVARDAVSEHVKVVAGDDLRKLVEECEACLYY